MSAESAAGDALRVALLTGGHDPHYARGLVRELAGRGVEVAVVGSGELAGCEEIRTGRVEFHDLIGRQDPADGLAAKVWRVLAYYGRLLAFAARTDTRLFHVLWFRKFPIVERTLFNLYFKLLGKKLVFTAHNVDDLARDGAKGGLAARLSLRFLYRIVDRVFVHTQRAKFQLVDTFGVPEYKVTLVPLGINDVVPVSSEGQQAARQKLGLGLDQRLLLFFGNIAPYKGVEDLVGALAHLVRDDPRLALVIAGRVKDRSCESYWREIEELIVELGVSDHVRKELRYIPDGEVGLFFKAADVCVLPYRRIDQSGVLGLSYAAGLPVIAADVGSMGEDILEGETGFLFEPGNALALAAKIRTYFRSDLFENLETRGRKISEYGAERFSWKTNADRSCAVYASLLR